MMDFVTAVLATEEIAGCLTRGLQALGSHRLKVVVGDTRSLEGSVDIDRCLERTYPNSSRWDYALGYAGRIYYVEVHPASTGEVQVVLEKLRWLKSWQGKSALALLRDRSTYHWLATDGVHITRYSKYARLLAQAGLEGPSRRLTLN